MAEPKTLTLTINGTEKEYPYGILYGEIAAEYQKDEKYPILMVMAGNRLRELGRSAKESTTIRFLTMQDKVGYNAYRRSLCLMMLKAIHNIMEHDETYKVGIHFVVSDGLYCTLQNGVTVNEEFLKQVKEYMQKLCEEAVPIEKRSMDTYDAVKLFHAHHMYDKENLFRYRRVSKANIYSMGGFEDYYYGCMVPNTSYLKRFDLKLYKEGFVLCLPSMEDPESIPAFIPEEKLFQVQNRSLKWGANMDIFTVADLNDRVVQGQTKELILTQEAYHEKQLAEIAAEIAAHPEKKLVMIAGPSSSGKTTFSHRLSTQLSVYGLKPHPIPVDDYFVNRELTPRDENGEYNFECLAAIDAKQFNEDMGRLLAGERVELPSFNFKTGKREYKGKYKQLGKNDILVIEGIHGLNDELSYALPRENKFKIYISALTQLNVDEHNRIPTTDGRLLRRIVRDARTRGITAQKTISMWPSVRRGEEEHIFPYQESCDVMFNSALIYELAVLKVYAEPLLFGISKEAPEYVEAKRLLKFLDYFVPIPADSIPMNSLVREFIGGSCFDV
ncbi:MAG: nucleoside kinase [Lachnospiraceae bacterium]|nr:nucleoside kinase [Lachnospiraceae bacterium]